MIDIKGNCKDLVCYFYNLCFFSLYRQLLIVCWKLMGSLLLNFGKKLDSQSPHSKSTQICWVNQFLVSSYSCSRSLRGLMLESVWLQGWDKNFVIQLLSICCILRCFLFCSRVFFGIRLLNRMVLCLFWLYG